MQMKVLMVQSGNVFQKILLLHYLIQNLVYMMVQHTAISVLIYEKLNFVSVVYMLKGFKKCNLKRINLVNQRGSEKNKLRQQILWGKKMSKNDNLKKKIIYMFLEKFRYILVYLDVYYVILTLVVLIISNCVTFSPFFFWLFLKIAFF